MCMTSGVSREGIHAMSFMLYLLFTALVYNAPVLLLVRLARHRLGPIVPRAIIAAGFAASTGYTLWKLEWEDVWRHGFPDNPGLLSVYAAYIAAYGAAGWLAGGFIQGPHPASPDMARRRSLAQSKRA